MCIIFGKADRIGDTQIIVAMDDTSELVMYSNRVELTPVTTDKYAAVDVKQKTKPNAAQAVMLLPFPCTDASQVSVVDMQNALEKYGEAMLKECHESLQEAKPQTKGRGGAESFSFGSKGTKTLAIHRAGSYIYSLATCINELPLVSQDALPLPQEIFAACRALYPSGYMFAVCGLVPSATKYKPFCMRFPLPAGGRVFVPTVHIHPHHHLQHQSQELNLRPSGAMAVHRLEDRTMSWGDAESDDDDEMEGVEITKGTKRRREDGKAGRDEEEKQGGAARKRLKRTALASNVAKTTRDFDHEVYVIMPGRRADYTTTFGFLPRHDIPDSKLQLLSDTRQYRYLRVPELVRDCLVLHAGLRLDAHCHMLAVELNDRSFANCDMTVICQSTGDVLPVRPIVKPAASASASAGDSKSTNTKLGGEMEWPNVRCDVCKQLPLQGARWRCTDINCKNLDLCTGCAEKTKAQKSTSFWPEHDDILSPKYIHNMQFHPELQPLV